MNYRSRRKPKIICPKPSNLIQIVEEELKQNSIDYSQKQIRKLLKDVYQQAERYRNQKKYADAKIYFDKFVEGELKSYALSCQYIYYLYYSSYNYRYYSKRNQNIEEEKLRAKQIQQQIKNSNTNVFDDVLKTNLSELLKFKNQFDHKDISNNIHQLAQIRYQRQKDAPPYYRDQDQNSDYQQQVQSYIQPQIIKKMLSPSLLKLRLKLINRKFYFYKTIGYQKQISNAQKLLILQNKSALQICPVQNYSKVIIKARQVKQKGDIKKAADLLKEVIYNKDLYDQKQKFYLCIIWIKYLRLVDRDGFDILSALDKAYALADLDMDRAQIMMQRRYILSQLSKKSTIQSHKGLTRYYQQKIKKPSKKDQMDSFLQYINFLKRIDEKLQAVKIYNQAIVAIPSKQTYLKAQFLKQLAFLLADLGKNQQALACYQKAELTHCTCPNDKIRLLWRIKMFKNIESIVQQSKNPQQLKTIAFLYRKQGDKLLSQNSPKNQVKQKYLEASKILDKAVLLLEDFSTIKLYMAEQAFCLKNAYNLNNEDNAIQQHQNRLLSEMKIINDYNYVLEAQKRDSTNQRVNLSSKMLQINYLGQFTLNSIFQNLQITDANIGYFNLRQLLTATISKLWKSGRYIESLNVFSKAAFTDYQYNLINQQPELIVLRKAYQTQKFYKRQNYKECLDVLKSFSCSSSLQNLIRIPNTVNKQLSLQLQKYQIISLWHEGNYEIACRLYADMIFYSGNDISAYLSVHKHDPSQRDFQLIRIYNSALFSGEKKKYEKCIKKMRKLQKMIIQKNGKVKDHKFYIKFASYSHEMGKRYKHVNDQRYIDTYTSFIQQIQNADKIKSISQNQEISKLFLTTQKMFVNLFFNQVKKMDDQLRALRDFYFTQNKNKIKFNELRDYIAEINHSLKNCQKIQKLNLIKSPQKIDELNTLKQCWNQTCFVIYKEAINKQVQGNNYKELKQLINDLKEQFMAMQSQRKQIFTVDKSFIDKLPKIAKQMQQKYTDQFESLISQKLSKAKQQIDQAYQYLNNRLQNINFKDDYDNNKSSNEIVQQLVKDNLEMKTQNQFFMDMIQAIQNRLSQNPQPTVQKKQYNDQQENSNQNNEQQTQIDIKSQILQQLTKIKDNRYNDLQSQIKKTKDEMKSAFDALNSNINHLMANRPESIDNKELMEKLVEGHQNMLCENQLFKDLIDETMNKSDDLASKLEELKSLVFGLQNVTKNTASIFDLEEQLKSLLKNNIYSQITSQSQIAITKMMTFIQQNSTKQNYLQQKILQYIDKNISKLLDYITAILDPNLEANVQKYFKRFKDDILIRDNKIKDLLKRLTDLQGNDNNKKNNINLNEHIKKLQQQIISTRQKVDGTTSDLKNLITLFNDKADVQDIKRLREQLFSRYLQSQDIGKKLQLLSSDTLVGNYHNLLENLQYLKNYIAVNDKKINLLSQKLGTKIVTSFNNILRNDDVKFDKHGKLRFKPEKNQVQMNVNFNSSNNEDMKKSRVSGSSMSNKQSHKDKKDSKTKFRSRNQNQKNQSIPNNKIDPQRIVFLDKGTNKIALEGQINRKINVVLMQSPNKFQH